MIFSLALAALSLSCHPLAAGAHKVPKTAEQLRVYQDIQEAAYKCEPFVAKYTAERRKAVEQRLKAGGAPGVDGRESQHTLAGDDLFEHGVYDDLQPSKEVTRLLSCQHPQDLPIRNRTCVLAPEVTQGPYYEKVGHPIRQLMAEYEPGLLTIMNIGVIDVETCKPVPNVLVDIWHANATGHYSAHPEPSPELVNELPAASGKRKGLLSPYPRTIPGETFLRGAWPSDEKGVASFTSIFPGYYTGRATHVHVKVWPEWDLLANGTFASGSMLHVGQFFFDDALNVAVDKLWPYNTNPIANLPNRGRTRNWDDSLQIYQDSHEGGYNPTFETYLLGGVLQQGIIGYITMGVNMSASYDDLYALPKHT